MPSCTKLVSRSHSFVCRDISDRLQEWCPNTRKLEKWRPKWKTLQEWNPNKRHTSRMTSAYETRLNKDVQMGHAPRLTSKYATDLNNDVQNGKRFKNGTQISDTLQECCPHTRHSRIMTSSRATYLKHDVHIRNKISWQYKNFLMT